MAKTGLPRTGVGLNEIGVPFWRTSAAARRLQRFRESWMADLSHTPTGRAADADAADRTYVGLAKQIYDLIAAGGVGPRARLPSERTLAGRFGVSRTLVREAIIALEMEGGVEVSVGSGIYVAEPPEARCVPFELPRGP